MTDKASIEAKIKSSKVLMYSKTSCPFCSTAKRIFQAMDVEYVFVELDIQQNGSYMQDALSEITGQHTVPNIFIGGEHIGGCSELKAGIANGSVLHKLEQAGVPFKMTQNPSTPLSLGKYYWAMLVLALLLAVQIFGVDARGVISSILGPQYLEGHEPNYDGTLLADGTYWGPFEPEKLKFEGDIDSLFVSRNVEVVASGFLWAEGPVWWRQEQALLFSDVPGDKIYKLTKKGVEIFIDHSGGWDGKSGSLSNIPDYENFVEHGSNGLALYGDDLIICHHGIRSITKVKLNSVKKGQRHSNQNYQVVVDEYQGKRLNSPNDVAIDRDGALWFTDPAYGFLLRSEPGSFEPKTGNDPLSGNPGDMPYLDERSKEDGTGLGGVYRYKDGSLDLVIDTIERPNGIAFSCDGQILYVSNSRKDKTSITAYQVSEEFPLKPLATFENDNSTGLCCFDGLTVDEENRVWTSAPKGVAIIDVLANKVVGKITFNTAISNVEFGDDGDVWISGLGHIWKMKRKQTKRCHQFNI